MGSFKDMTGEVYGRLTVKGRAPRDVLDHGSVKWLCQCECGNIVIIRRDKLLAGRVSCGCIRKEQVERTRQAKLAEKLAREPGKAGRPRKEKPPPKPKPPKSMQRVNRPRPFSAPREAKPIKAYGFTITSRCKQCKQTFERPSGEWGYKIGNDLFCRYKCMREAEKERDLM